MARYPAGQSIALSRTIKDATGTLTNASASALTVERSNADGSFTTTSYSNATNDGTGLYHWDIPLADIATIAHYQWSDDFTVGAFHAVGFGELDVFDPFDVAVLPLQDAKDTLNIPQATTMYDAALTSKIATIETNLERYIGGPIVNRTVTERVDMDSSSWEIKLGKRPLASVTSIADVATGLPLDVTALDLDPDSRIVRRKDGQQFVTNNGVVTVVYVAGWGTTVPPAFGEAARIILQHLWETERGQSSVPQYGGEETVTPPGFGYAVPNRALELLAPYAKAGAVA